MGTIGTESQVLRSNHQGRGGVGCGWGIVVGVRVLVLGYGC